MMATVLAFLTMGGYGFYIWLSYSAVLAFLFIQWLLPWRRWQKYRRRQQTHE